MPNADIHSLSLPHWLGGGAVQWSTAFAAMFFLTTSCRTIVIAILPVDGLAYLGSAQAVSVLFAAVSTLGVCTSVLMPVLVRRIRTRGVFHAAVIAAIVAPLLLGLGGFPLFLAGMVCWMFSTLAFEVSLNLYTMHHIRRRDLAAFEPKRVLFMAIAYSVGPWLGGEPSHVSERRGRGVQPFLRTRLPQPEHPEIGHRRHRDQHGEHVR